MPRIPSLIFPLLLILAETSIYLSNDMYLPALASIMRDFHSTAPQVQLTLTAWFLGATSVDLVVGPLSDRVGRRPILIAGMLLFVLSTLFCMLASSLLLLTLARFIQGSTVCFIVIAGYASIHELFDQKNAIRLLAAMNGIVVLAPAFGPFLGGLLLLAFSWRWIFGLLSLVGLIVLLALFRWMPEPLPASERHPLSLLSLLKQYLAILSNQRFMLYVLAYCLIFCGFIAWLVAGPFFVIIQFHYQPLIFGCLQLLVFGFYIFASSRVKTMMDAIGVNKLIERGLILSFAGALLATVLALSAPTYLSGLIVGTTLFSFGFGYLSAPLQRLAIESCAEPMGARMSILSTMMGISGLLATVLVSLLYNGHLISLAEILLTTSTLAGIFYLFEKMHQA